MSSLETLYSGQVIFSIQFRKPNYLVIPPTSATPQFLYKLAPAPRVMRGMIAYIPLYVNLTSTQGCIRGLAHACVCVEASKEEGDVRGRMCTR